MTNLWVTFSTDISTNFIESSGNIIYNLNNLYNFNGNLVDTTSNFIIYELSNNPIQSGISLQPSNWNQFSLNSNLSPFQGYWLGGINTNLPQIFTNNSELQTAVNTWTNNPISVVNIYGLIENWNVENVTNMSGMFSGATSFNGNISNWDVGNVTNMSNMFDGAINFNQDISNWNIENVTDVNLNEMFKNVTFFTGMNDKIDPNGTPFNYFISQRNRTTSVSIRAYSLIKYSTSGGTILILSESFSEVPDSDFDRIKNALSITNMDDLVNYSFTSSQDPTSRDILSVWGINSDSTGTNYNYNLSGDITNYIFSTLGELNTLTFTRRT